MTRWSRGQGEVDQSLEKRQLQKVTGEAANGEAMLERAERVLASAAAVIDGDPDTAYVLAYDVARYASTALLAHQGLRPTTSGGHYVVELVVRAQFGDGFRRFGAMRRRRNELEYPTISGDATSQDEARQAINDAAAMLGAARQLLPSLGLY